MVLIDIPMPDCCLTCFASAGYGCKITGQLLLYGEMHKPPRPESCPLIDVEEKEIQERTSHVSWKTRKVYVKKERQRDDNTGGV